MSVKSFLKFTEWELEENCYEEEGNNEEEGDSSEEDDDDEEIPRDITFIPSIIKRVQSSRYQE